MIVVWTVWALSSVLIVTSFFYHPSVPPFYPPWTVLHHGNTWAFVNGYGKVDDVRYISRARAEDAMEWHRDFIAKWESGGQQRHEEQQKLESAPGYWEKEE